MKKLSSIRSCQLNEIKLEVSYKCNLNCIHCSSEASLCASKGITWPQAKSIIEQAAQLSVKTVSFSGGEPLLWEPLLDAIELCSSYGMAVKLYTNATTDNFVSLSSHFVRQNVAIIISLHGFESVHDSITLVPGSFQKACCSICEISKMGCTPEVHFVPTQINYMELHGLALFLREKGVRKISALRFVPHGRGRENCSLTLTYEQHMKLKDAIIQLRKQDIQVRTGAPFNILLLNDQPMCTSGSDKLVVAPDLRIYPCDAFKQINPFPDGAYDTFSSLDGSTLQECWDNSIYLKLVRAMVSECTPPECIACANYSLCRSGCLAQKCLLTNSFTPQVDPSCCVQLSGALND